LADTYTTSLRLIKPEVGANEDTWGDDLNDAMTAMVDEAVAGVVSVSVTAGNVTLSTNNGAADQHRPALLILTGTPGATRTITFPDVEKITRVFNNSDSAATLTAGAGTTVTVPAGEYLTVYSDGATNIAAFRTSLARRKAMPPVTLTDGASVAVDATKGCVFDLTMAGDRTLSNPSSAVSGQPFLFRVKASGADRTLTLDTKFRFGTDFTALTATTSAKTDFIACIYHSTDDKFDVVAYDKGH